MSALAGVIVGLLVVAYVASGILTVLIYNTATDGGVDGWRGAAKTFATWPVAVFTVLSRLYALWKTKRELDKLRGGR